MKIYETFVSIQGESGFTGFPCFFIRTAGCNLNCRYCDTRYAKQQGSYSSVAIDNLVSLASESGLKLIEITGGEPLCQKEETCLLCDKLLSQGFTVLIETNGSISIEGLPSDVIKIIDCKTPSSGEAEKMLFYNFQLLNNKDEIKFVIADYKDYQYALYIINEYNLQRFENKILFSPVYNLLPPHTLAEWIISDKLNVRLQLQIHKFIDMK